MGKIDVIMKEFWRDNGRFADLFNAVVFRGREILRPEDFDKRDTDVSAGVRGRKKYLEALGKARDIVKKAALGTEFVLMGIENQTKTDYSMPVRTMLYDALGYWKECRILSNQNRQKEGITAEEFLSIGKKDRIHPIVTLVLYYGEDPWDGPRSLRDMLISTSEEIHVLIPDYPLNLVEIRDSENLQFRNSDVRQVFSIVRKIYQKTIDSTFCNIRGDLVEVIGTIVGSEKMVKAVENEKGMMDMCRALEEMMQEREIKGKIEAYLEMGISIEEIARKINYTTAEINALIGTKDRPIS